MKMLYLLLFLASVALAQPDARAVVRTTGQFDVDGTVLYSVFIASKEDDLEEITISAALPAGTRFLESIQKPLSGTYDGVQHDQVSWRVPKLERDTVLGPFVFRVSLDGTADTVPATILAAAAFNRPVPQLVESSAPQGTLVPLAESGSITIDARGTLDASGQNAPVFIGDTGVTIFIPEGAVSERVTLTVTRLNAAENNLPKTDPATWWCSLYKMTSDPQIRFNKPVSFAFPSRRALTPGLETALFTSTDLESWQGPSGVTVQATRPERAIGFGFGGGQFGGGSQCFSQFGFTTCGFGGGFGFGGFGAFGYVEQDNIRGKVSGSQLSTTGTTAAQFLTSPPSIIAILIGLRP